MNSNLESNALQRFEQAEVWQQGYEDNPEWVAKHRIMEAMLPRGAKNILDVGCGNGSQGRLLSRHYSVTGIDRSEMALRQTGFTCLQAWSQTLPVAAKSFDAVWASQLLEHLPDSLLVQTVTDMKRTARHWLMVSVPYRENLRFRQCQCHSCRQSFHIYGHVQSFSLAKLQHLLEPCTLQSWAFCGPCDMAYYPVLLWIRQLLGKKWFSYPPAYPICPHCGHLEKEVWYGNRIARFCDRLNTKFRRSREPIGARWLISLWRVAKRA